MTQDQFNWAFTHQGPIAQAQSELGPEIFKAHFEYAPATSKVITDKWLSCPPEPATQVFVFTNTIVTFQTLFILLYFCKINLELLLLFKTMFILFVVII